MIGCDNEMKEFDWSVDGQVLPHGASERSVVGNSDSSVVKYVHAACVETGLSSLRFGWLLKLSRRSEEMGVPASLDVSSPVAGASVAGL